jgi:septal ring factor EnvC (AmiA/AmiB activator)
MDWTTVIVAILGSGVITAVVNGLFGKRKNDVEADKTAIDAALSLVKSMQDRLDKLTARLDRLEEELDRREMTIDALEEENKSLREKIQELEDDRKRQIETNRRQGKRIAELLVRIQELESKLDGSAK